MFDDARASTGAAFALEAVHLPCGGAVGELGQPTKFGYAGSDAGPYGKQMVEVGAGSPKPGGQASDENSSICSRQYLIRMGKGGFLVRRP